MQTIALWTFLWAAVIVAICAAFSMIKENDKVFDWKDSIADEMSDKFNVAYNVAFQIVDETFPTRSVMYKTELMDSIQVIALRLFWRKADESGWMPHHFISRVLPDELYRHPSWGGLIVEA